MDKVERDKSPKVRGRKTTDSKTKLLLAPGPGGEIAGDDGCIIPAPKAGDIEKLVVGLKYGSAGQTIEGPVTIVASACTFLRIPMGETIHLEAGQSAYIHVPNAQLHLNTKYLESGWTGKREVSLATGPQNEKIIITKQ